jgi:DNA repair photolyase
MGKNVPLLDVAPIQRKSAMLSRSSLACLKTLPTVNLTLGCGHQRIYCYTQGYSIFPGDCRVRYYANAYEKLADELPRKRKRPTAVYFSPSSDLFQPIPEVQELAYQMIELLLEHNVGVAFLSKGQIPERHLQLLLTRPELVRAQIGLISLDTKILQAFEPGAASADTRLAQARRLTEGGIATQFRLYPILPGLTDDDDSLDSLCNAIAQTGATKIAASALFSRPRLFSILKQKLRKRSPDLLERLLPHYNKTHQIGIHAEQSRVHALPIEKRREIYERLRRIAKSHGLTVQLCGCKNPDITSQSCQISGDWSQRKQLPLFPEHD